MVKITKFLEYLEYQDIFWKTFFVKYIKVYITRKTIQFHQLFIVFYLMKIFCTLLEVTALLLTAYVIHRQNFGHFLVYFRSGIQPNTKIKCYCGSHLQIPIYRPY